MIWITLKLFYLFLYDLTAEKTSLNGNTRLRFFM